MIHVHIHPLNRANRGLQGLMESCRVSAVIYCCVCKCVNVFLASSFARRLLMNPAGFGQKCSWIMFHISPVNWVVIDLGVVTCTWQVSLLDSKCERLASAWPSEQCRIYWGGTSLNDSHPREAEVSVLRRIQMDPSITGHRCEKVKTGSRASWDWIALPVITQTECPWELSSGK